MCAAAGDAGEVYKNITLYVLNQGQQGYDKLQKLKTTRNQLQKMWDKYSYDLVTRVISQPTQLLTPATCPEATDMGSVELEDGAHLALVLHQPLNYMDKLVDTVGKDTEKVSCLLRYAHGSHVRLLGWETFRHSMQQTAVLLLPSFTTVSQAAHNCCDSCIC